MDSILLNGKGTMTTQLLMIQFLLNEQATINAPRKISRMARNVERRQQNTT